MQAPVDYAKYEFLDLDDAVLFVFNGLDLMLLDKSGMVPQSNKLDPVRVGRCITKMYPANNDNRIIFGTQQGERIQFVNYDFMSNTRISQTASWKVAKVTDMCVSDMVLYAVLDQSIIIACDMSTGETLWTRFETGAIQRGIVAQNGFLVYCCQGLIKRVQDKDIQVSRIPLINASSVEHQDTRNIYLTSNNGKNVGCFYTVNESLKWQVYGRKPILDSVVVKDTREHDIMLAQTEDYVAIVNLTTGASESSVRTKNLYRIRVTGDHVLLQKSKGGVTLIPGVPNE
jgi:outer membrane protein assembly factor BamB